ncbi:MAG TPA: multicopper oxidase domain-containing protein [Gemmatimonadaceae bacterium]|nr:multicopper oxidase domain-containing protein [Gemmatimonadaceae bacterium]
MSRTPLAVALCFCMTTAAAAQPGRVHTYYVAADEVAWDYAPSGHDMLTGTAFDTLTERPRPGTSLYINVRSGTGWVGRKYKKALYREYTDASFTRLATRAPEWEHLGYMGPLLRAEVGDTIKVVFRNNATRPYSMHPHGVFYDKDSEGTPYRDGTTGADKADDAVPPGGSHTYVWAVPERAGPGPHDPTSIMWMYHSHVDEGKDINAGLMGPMIITARGGSKADGTPKDVDREFVVLFTDGEESDSWYIDENLEANAGVPPDSARSMPGFNLSNIMPNMNGWVYGNMPMLTVTQGERVRWYVMASTNGFDFHTPHWHGHTVLMHGNRMDIISIEPMMMAHVDMVADNPGIWFFHCHVKDHLNLGMAARFAVLPANQVARAEMQRTLLADALSPLPARVGAGGIAFATQVPGWTARLDAPGEPSTVAFRAMGDGFHATMGPAAVLFNPSISASGAYRVGAVFSQSKATPHPEAYGLVVGGKDLDRDEQDYLYFLVRQDGKFLVKHRAGAETHTIVDWTAHDAVRSVDASGKTTNALAVESLPDAVRFLANGMEVTRLPRSAMLKTDGMVGLRINHNLDVHIAEFAVTPATP